MHSTIFGPSQLTMKSAKVFGWLLLATIVTKATCISNTAFFEQIKNKGDIEDIDAIPDELDDTTFVLGGNAEDDLDEDGLKEALSANTALAVLDNARRLRLSQKPWVHIHFHFHRRRSSQIIRDSGKAANTRCVMKSIIVNLAQPKKITHTFCLEMTPVGDAGYHVSLVHDKDTLLDQRVQLKGQETEICQPYITDPETKACINIRQDGTELCTSLVADFWADHKIAMDFGCMTPRTATE